MKSLLLALLLFVPLPSNTQDPVVAKRDNIYVEFLTDCNWMVWGLEGKIKLKAAKGNYVGFRAWEPNRALGSIEFRGHVVYRELPYPWGRDYLIMNHSAFLAEPPPFLPASTWNYGIHYNELGGTGFSNAGAIMRVWGPCIYVRLYHGTARIKHGDEIITVRVDEDNYAQYPPWQVVLK